MQRIIKTLFVSVLLFSSACENEKVRPSSNITVQDRTINTYTGIVVSTAFDVDLTISNGEEKIEIEANDNLHAHIDVLKNGDDQPSPRKTTFFCCWCFLFWRLFCDPGGHKSDRCALREEEKQGYLLFLLLLSCLVLSVSSH